MIEEVSKLSFGPERTIEKILQDDNLDYIHIIFNKEEGLPIHYSNSNVYMTVLQGQLSISLEEQDSHLYPSGTLLKIPFHTKMNVQNLHDETLELIVIKAPSPRKYKAE